MVLQLCHHLAQYLIDVFSTWLEEVARTPVKYLSANEHASIDKVILR